MEPNLTNSQEPNSKTVFVHTDTSGGQKKWHNFSLCSRGFESGLHSHVKLHTRQLQHI